MNAMGMAGRLLVGELARRAPHVRRGQHDLARVSAESARGQHPLSTAERSDPGAELRDHPRHLESRYERHARRLRVQPHAHVHVGEVHSRGAHLDAHVVRRHGG